MAETLRKMLITDKPRTMPDIQVHKHDSFSIAAQYTRSCFFFIKKKMKFFNVGLLCFLLIGILAAMSEGIRPEPENAMRHGEAGCRGGGQRRRGGRPPSPPEEENPPDVPEGDDAEDADP